MPDLSKCINNVAYEMMQEVLSYVARQVWDVISSKVVHKI